MGSMAHTRDRDRYVNGINNFPGKECQMHTLPPLAPEDWPLQLPCQYCTDSQDSGHSYFILGSCRFHYAFVFLHIPLKTVAPFPLLTILLREALPYISKLPPITHPIRHSNHLSRVFITPKTRSTKPYNFLWKTFLTLFLCVP